MEEKGRDSWGEQGVGNAGGTLEDDAGRGGACGL
jgi:hypothetical protein